MDKTLFAPPQKLWNDSIPQRTRQQVGFNHGFEAVRNGFRNHSQ